MGYFVALVNKFIIIYKKGLKPIKPFLLFYSVLVIISLFLLMFYGYQGSFLSLNSHYSTFTDNIFPFITLLGDSLVAGSLAVLLLVRRNLPLTCLAILSIAVSGIIVLLLKGFVFDEWHRPITVLGEARVHFINGITERYRSFPSGHATSIFSAGSIIAYAYLDYKKYIQLVILIVCCLVAYSRIYLGSHFLGDVLAGSMLGLIISITLVILNGDKLTNKINEIKINTIKKVKLTLILLSFLGLALKIVIYLFI